MPAPEQLSLFEVAAAGREAKSEINSEVHAEVNLERGPLAHRRRLHQRLDELLPDGLSRLILTDHRTVLVSGRPADHGGWIVRLHWCLALAPDDVVHAIAAVLAGPQRGRARREARKTLRTWMTHYRETAGPGPAPDDWHAVIDEHRRAPGGAPGWAGHVHDLEAIRDEINDRYFGGRLNVDIAWSRAGKAGSSGRARRATRSRRGRSTLKLGSWSEEDHLVRIHPVLDHPSVPHYVVASVIHHELLHAELGTEIRDGRRHHHTPEFRRREKEFAEHEEARRWIHERLGELLKRRGRLR